MALFKVREVKHGACNQYSYEGEAQLTVDAESSGDLLAQLQRLFGKHIDTRAIVGGHWSGGMCLTFADGRWFRIAKVAV